MAKRASATGKIILCGEYAMACTGAPGIAFPSKESISVEFDERRGFGLVVIWDERTLQPEWAMYAGQIAELLGQKMGRRLEGKLRITSDLALGKGMGSSTALVIALSKAIVGPNAKDIALHIEDSMNPGHSGMDFAVIWEGKPIFYKKGTTPIPITLSKDITKNMRLIDSGMPSETTPSLVAWVRSRKEELQQPLAIIAATAEKVVQGANFKELIRAHHLAQIALGVVTKNAQEIIQTIEKSGGAAKVIGAGGRTSGSGMIIAFD